MLHSIERRMEAGMRNFFRGGFFISISISILSILSKSILKISISISSIISISIISISTTKIVGINIVFITRWLQRSLRNLERCPAWGLDVVDVADHDNEEGDGDDHDFDHGESGDDGHDYDHGWSRVNQMMMMMNVPTWLWFNWAELPFAKDGIRVQQNNNPPLPFPFHS